MQLHVQCVVDDPTIWGTTQTGMQASVGRCVQTLRAMNAACNPDKFGLLHYVYRQEKLGTRATVIEVEGTHVKTASRP